MSLNNFNNSWVFLKIIFLFIDEVLSEKNRVKYSLKLKKKKFFSFILESFYLLSLLV